MQRLANRDRVAVIERGSQQHRRFRDRAQRRRMGHVAAQQDVIPPGDGFDLTPQLAFQAAGSDDRQSRLRMAPAPAFQ